MNIIHDQSKKLARLSSTMEAWNESPYGKVLRMLNNETLEILYQFCLQYANVSSSNDFKETRQKIVHDYYAPDTYRECDLVPPLCRSFGMTAIFSADVSNHHMFLYWKNGVADEQDIPSDPIWNPFFTRLGKFDIHHATTPLAIYHFTTFTPDYQDGARKTVASAKAQFKAWCDAFQQSISQIVIKLVVANPLDLCLALSKDKIPASPWSELHLESACFNVIDTSYLVDRVGLINLLVSAVPLLQSSSSSSIFMESTNQPWSEETKLLRRLLCGDVALICNILGVSPIPYLTKATTRGVTQDLPTIYDFSNKNTAPGVNKIVWKIPALGDSSVAKPLKVSFDSDDLIKLLCGIYDEMFTTEKNKIPMYTNASFAALLAFMKHRILTDWDQVILGFVDALIVHPDRTYCPDLQLQFHLFGVSNMFPNVCSKDQLQQNSQISRIVFGVPRQSLQSIYEKSSNALSTFEASTP